MISSPAPIRSSAPSNIDQLDAPLASLSFAQLGLDRALCDAAKQMGLVNPSAIQQQVIAPILQQCDVLALAPTGSGKTAAYALPIVQAGLRSLILVPTRELATQVGKVFSQLCRILNEPAKIVVAIGGLSINPQMMQLRGGADVLISTPGRLLDLIEHNAVRLSDFQTIVLDEADRLLALGFSEELEKISALLYSKKQADQKKQTLMFSATFEAKIKILAGRWLNNALTFEIQAQGDDKPDIIQRAIAVDDKRRTQLLVQLMKDNSWPSVLVFVASKYGASHVAEKLQRKSISAKAFHGDLSQGARNQALDDFKNKGCAVLVTTDLAARGLDIKELPVVINYDLPRSATDYTHRVGRTGRAGAQGTAINFVTPEQTKHFQLIEKKNQLRLTIEVVSGFEPG